MKITIKALLGLAVAGAIMVPAVSSAQARGYEFKLNGKTYGTSRNMSGPRGCNSGLYDRYGRQVCPLNGVSSPRAEWEQIVRQECPVNEYGDSKCVGGIVAVGLNCPQNLSRCTYYTVVRTFERRYDGRRGTVSIGDIDRLGRELWIEREGSSLWNAFLRCKTMQETNSQYSRPC